VIATLPVDLYVDVNQITDWFGSASAPIVSSATGEGALPIQEAMRLISNASHAMNGLSAYYEAAVEALTPLNLAEDLSPDVARDFSSDYAQVARLMTSNLVMLKTIFFMAESNSRWKPHLSMLRKYTRTSVRTLANLRNLYEDMARSLDVIAGEDRHVDSIANVSAESSKDLIADSHKKYKLTPPVWH